VVDYAYGQGMFVVLNIHWDGGWLQDHPTSAFQVKVNQKQQAYWTQIANTFKAYDEHLLFAGTNEVHANYGRPSTENITVQLSFNQTFVDAVRATGDGNVSRTLVVQTYNTNIQHGLEFMVLPKDTIADRLMVEVHFYDPYDYTLNEKGECRYWGAPYPAQNKCSWADQAYVDGQFARLRAKWVDHGVPVILGEYGVASRPKLDVDARQYYLGYLNRAAVLNGIHTFYWDNGVKPGASGAFALFDRSGGEIVDPGALQAVLSGTKPHGSH
jgi:aryl-phospho-beta-D-glucosidase BglC (GH1 family)